jgi:metal-responsive CopG/Arc/MetJ family transcriptional regulator
VVKKDMTIEKRGLKNRATFSTTLDKKLLIQLDKLSVKTRIPKSKLVDEAIEDLLKKYPDNES